MFFEKLQTRKNDGFTLVELIVVIAILAILAGIGVPAYSGYVEKANIAADQTLVGEVANALTLYYYDNISNESAPKSGYVTLTSSGATADAAGTAAMEAVFGEKWPTEAVLKYNGWADNGMTGVALRQGEMAAFVGTSSYLTGSTPEKLMDNVVDLTYAATGIFKGMDANLKYQAIEGNLFGGDPKKMKAMCEQFGIATTTNSNGKTVLDSSVTDEQLANLLVFGAAQQVTEGNTTYVTTWVDEYAGLAAFASMNSKDANIQAAYEKMNADLANATSKVDVDNILKTFKEDSAVSTGWNAYYETEDYMDDMVAFWNIMEAVDAAGSEVTPSDITSAEFFTSDKVSDIFDTYISAAETVGNMTSEQISTMQAAVNAGGIVLQLYTNGSVDCSSAKAMGR